MSDEQPRILGIDFGTSRIGVAVSDALGLTAQPVEMIPFKGDIEAVCRRIGELAAEKSARVVVVGLPKNMDATEGEAAQKARSFGNRLELQTGLQVVFIDERMTSMLAEQALDWKGKSRKAKQKAVQKGSIDVVAAQLILQTYLERRRHAADAADVDSDTDVDADADDGAGD